MNTKTFNKQINASFILLFVSCLLFAICPVTAKAQSEADSVTVGKYLDSIRSNRAALYQFFSKMPKGGDLHNHLTGSVYAETYFDLAVANRYYANMKTGMLYTQQQKDTLKDTANVIQLSDTMKKFHNKKVTLLDLWSIRNFTPCHTALPPDEYFFGTFGLFGAVTTDNNLATLLAELKLRGIKENQQYLEIMMTSPKYKAGSCSSVDTSSYNSKLSEAINQKSADKLFAVLADLYEKFNSCQNIQNYIRDYNVMIDSIDITANKKIGKDSSQIKCLYQIYTGRNTTPLAVFTNIYISFKVCQKSEKIVGMNIVQAENGEQSMSDYWGHMRMFQFFAKPDTMPVNMALHAGELTIGLVKPEDLTSHISDAVYVAKAKRIGHGVDIAFEKKSDKLMKTMRDSSIAVEINLTSNEFILGVKDAAHPLPLYLKNGVPVVISTDDAGILRTNHAEQFVLAAERYKEVNYKAIKQMVRNSIQYSFAQPAVKTELKEQLEQKLQDFEKEMADYIKNLK